MFHYSNSRYTPGYYNADFMVPCIATVCCSVAGCGFILKGIIMTSEAYTSQFYNDLNRILGPTFLWLGFVVVTVAVNLGCFTLKKKRALESQIIQNQSMQDTSQPQLYSPSLVPNNPCLHVYDTENRGLTADIPPSYSSFGQAPVFQVPYSFQEQSSSHPGMETVKPATGVSSHPPYPQQLSYNPDFISPVPYRGDL